MPTFAKSLVLAAAASVTVATASPNCQVPSAPASATYATRLSHFNRKSGATDFAVRFDKSDGASGYRLCWDIQGRGKFDSNTWKISATCIDLDGDTTEYNNGERVAAAPRTVNKYKNASPFVCKAGQNDDNYATVVQLKNIAVTDKRVATGSVNWAYPKGIPKDATYEICLAQDKGPYGVTQNRNCFLSAPGASSYSFTVPLGSAVGLIHAEVRQGGACLADMDTSDPVSVPQMYVPFGSHLTNGMSVCLVESGTKGRLKYGPCSSSDVVKVTAEISEAGDYTGVYRTIKAQCVVTKGSSVALGKCPHVDEVGRANSGWDPYRKTGTRSSVARQYIREFGSGMCLPFGKDLVEMGKRPKLVQCAELMFSS